MRLLLLGGTREARNIAAALRREPGLSLTVSLARPERIPRPYGWPVRIGGFGGDKAYAEWLTSAGATAVLDATHPFATQMGRRSVALADTLGIEYVRFLRRSWMPSDGDNWTFFNAPEEAEAKIPEGSTVFLATGQNDLEHFGRLAGRRVLCRIRGEATQPFPFQDGRFVVGTRPFTVYDECDFFVREGVDWVVSQNSGGQGSWPKIEAARELGLPVAMIRRPPQPDGLKINTVAEAISWVRRRLRAPGV